MLPVIIITIMLLAPAGVQMTKPVGDINNIAYEGKVYLSYINDTPTFIQGGKGEYEAVSYTHLTLPTTERV